MNAIYGGSGKRGDRFERNLWWWWWWGAAEREEHRTSMCGYARASNAVERWAARCEPAEKPMIPSRNEVGLSPYAEAFALQCLDGIDG